MTNYPSSNSDNDHALIRQLQSGDTAAFEPLTKKYWHQVHFVCLKYLRDVELASDAAQETFISAFTGIGTFDSARDFRPWLLKIAVNKSLRLIKKDQKHRTLAREIQPTKPSSSNPSEVFADKQLIDDCLARLEFDEQILFVLRHGLDLAYDEMAQILEKPVGSVKGELFRVRRKLKEMLENVQGKEVENVV